MAKRLFFDRATGLYNRYFPSGYDEDKIIDHWMEENRSDKACFILNCDRLREKAREFTRFFPGMVSYAVKANYDTQVLKTLWDAGIHSFDLASQEEIDQVTGLFDNWGGQPKYFYHNPWKSMSSLESAYHEHGIKNFAVNSYRELEKISIVTKNDPDVLISLRLYIPAMSIFGLAKGGAPLDEAAEIAKKVKQKKMRLAFYYHLGSQCVDPGEYAKAMYIVSDFIRKNKVTPELINVGGGFPARYGTDVPPISEFLSVIQHHAPKDIPLMCEPGRAISASSTRVVTQVVDVVPDRNLVVLNDGVYGSLSEFRQGEGKLLPSYTIYAHDKAKRSQKTVSRKVRGPTCDISADVLPFMMDFPVDLQPNDAVVFDALGAYGMVQSSNFNGFRPKYQFVIGGYRKRKRLNLANIIGYTD